MNAIRYSLRIKLQSQMLWMVLALVAVVGCDKDNPISDQDDLGLITPTEIVVSVKQDQGKAVITGKVDANVAVYLKYNANNGAILKKDISNNDGHFSLEVVLFRGFKQEFVVYSSREKDEITLESEKRVVEEIPAKTSSLMLSLTQIKEKLLAHQWKSDQLSSHIIIKQTSATPPYDMFVTTAQKYFEFKEDGAFYFKVTSPLEFTDTKGVWAIQDNFNMQIDTTIPMGSMRLENIRIQELTDNRFVFVTDISDGVFFITLIKE